LLKVKNQLELRKIETEKFDLKYKLKTLAHLRADFLGSQKK
jgi:hypothetical protein